VGVSGIPVEQKKAARMGAGGPRAIAHRPVEQTKAARMGAGVPQAVAHRPVDRGGAPARGQANPAGHQRPDRPVEEDGGMRIELIIATGRGKTPVGIITASVRSTISFASARVLPHVQGSPRRSS